MKKKLLNKLINWLDDEILQRDYVSLEMYEMLQDHLGDAEDKTEQGKQALYVMCQERDIAYGRAEYAEELMENTKSVMESHVWGGKTRVITVDNCRVQIDIPNEFPMPREQVGLHVIGAVTRLLDKEGLTPAPSESTGVSLGTDMVGFEAAMTRHRQLVEASGIEKELLGNSVASASWAELSDREQRKFILAAENPSSPTKEKQ